MKIWVAVISIVLIGSGITGYLQYHHHQVVEAAKPKCAHPSVKGNISFSTGEKIYHAPYDSDYNRTVVETGGGERMFCSEHDAQVAGWRHTNAPAYADQSKCVHIKGCWEAINGNGQ